MADRIIHCAHDGKAHAATELLCSQCKSKLSLVRPGEDFLNHRFAVLKADHETEASICWLVVDRLAGGVNRILREIFPAADIAQRGKQRFDSLCKTLHQAPADILLRPLLHFSREGRCYVVEEVPDGTPLQEALASGALGEQQASGHFWSLVEALNALASPRSPLYHGALRPSTVRLRANGSPPLLTDPACLEHTVTRDHPMISEAAEQQDLRDAADLGFRMLRGNESESVSTVLGRIRDDGFTSALDWALRPENGRPCSARELLQVRDLVRLAESGRKEGREEAAVARYDEALALCHASRLRTVVGEMRERLRKNPPTPPTSMRCIGCNLTYSSDRKFCGKCGKPLAHLASPKQADAPELPHIAEPKMCPVCRRIYGAPGVTFCANCGKALVDAPTEPEPPLPAEPTPCYGTEHTSRYNDWLELHRTPEQLKALRQIAHVPEGAPIPLLKGEQAAAAPKDRYEAEMEFWSVAASGSEAEMPVQEPAPSPDGSNTETTEESPVKSVADSPEDTKPPSIFGTSTGTAAPTIGSATSLPIRILIGCALLALVVVGIFLVVRSQMDAKFDSAVARGALVAPAGDNAYEIYQAAQKDGRSVDQMEKKAISVLRPRTEAQLRKHRDGDLTAVEWQELQKIYEWLARISGSDEDRAGVAYATGRLALQNSDFKAAYDSFQRAVQLRPGWNYGLNSLGRTSVRLNNLDAAIAFYDQAVKADPSWVVPRLNLGAAYVRQRRLDEAEAQYTEALKLDDSRPTTHFLLAQLNDAKGGGARRSACQQYREALRLNKGQTGNFDLAWTERRVNGFCVSAGY
jgi:hypothetical protein